MGPAEKQTSQKCFLLNYLFRDRNGRFEIVLYAVSDRRRPVRITVDDFRPLFFTARSTPAKEAAAAERRELPLRSMTGGGPVDCLYFPTYAAFLDAGRTLREKGMAVYESDVNPADRFLMERSVRGGFEATGPWQERDGTLACRNPRIRGAHVDPVLSVLSLDIETNAASGEILSLACCGKNQRVIILGAGNGDATTRYCRSEKDLLTLFFDHLKREDPDIIIGWNIVAFDLLMLQNRCAALSVPFRMGRDDGGRVTESAASGRLTARIPGRAVIDVPDLLRATFHDFEEYSLDFVAGAMLGKRKTITGKGAEKIREINRLFREDPAGLAAYNLNDAVLTKEIFERADLLAGAVARTKRSGLPLERTGGSVAAFDWLYLPRLHRAGFVAPDAADAPPPPAPLPGGFVLEPKPGLYHTVLSFDFRSLYPSIIMTFNIDPLGLVLASPDRVAGPAGPSFAAGPAILPGIIAELMAARQRAKDERNTHESQAIKILMNSLYGVLGATGCRFFSADLASTITRTGQFIFKQTMEHILESTGFPVIYGDTDSLFVHRGEQAGAGTSADGNTIAAETTAWLAASLKEQFGVTSALLLQFEHCFRHFFIPSLRGSQQGSKKHYCGALEENGSLRLVFKGMESVRRDWTELAKELQQELIMRLFAGRPCEDVIASVVQDVRAGRADDKLVYAKALRKRLDEYTGALPHHVQAAKLLKTPGHLIRYYMTTSGPQPVEHRTAPIDYDHYVDTQVRPIADSILELFGTSFERLVSGQQELF